MEKTLENQGHSHHRHPHVHADPSTGKAFLWGILLNTGFVAAEFIAGFWYNSMGLLADAGHNLGDVSGLLISLTAFLLARKRRAVNYTYGYRKATILASLLNAVILFIAVGAIILECVRKFYDPVPVGGLPIMITAGIGIAVNGATVLLFLKKRGEDLNVKGAYVHMLADTLVSVGVVLSGALILWTGWSVLDPIIGLVIAVVILISAWDLMRESLRLTIDGVPEGIDLDEMRGHMLEIGNVRDVHHLHIWPISTTENALTAHVVLNDPAKMDETKEELHQELDEHGVSHSTLEFETAGFRCREADL